MNIHNDRLLRGLRGVGFCLLLIVSSCKDDDDPSPASESDQYVNDWILENMQSYYLWNDKLPSSPDKKQAPEKFFNGLLYKDDRFSWIQENYQDLLNSLQGVNKEAGFEFVLYREGSSTNNVIAQIVYIKPSSPASATALKRGDVITHINGTQITTENYQSLLSAMGQAYTVQYKPLQIETENFGAPQTLSLTPVEYKENPNYLSTVITADEHKIGYYVYNFFATSSDGESLVYDQQMENIIVGFKSSGITDLVLDLRFNSGGSETSANTLASLIGSGVDNSKVFLKREYNAQLKNAIINDSDMGASYLTSNFQTKASNVGSQLQGNRLYVLTSSRTASASELVINALRPYMDVYIVGDTTYGKNVGSTSLYEENDPKNTWGMQPIIVKVYNALDKSDYSTGFYPNLLALDNSVLLYPLGDIRENLLSQAIAQITGDGSLGRKSSASSELKMIGHSLDKKPGAFNLIVSPETLPDVLQPN